MVVKAENLLVDVLSEYEIAGVKRLQVRDAKNKKESPRTFLETALREATDDDMDHIFYLFTDEETGEDRTIKLQKDFIDAIPKLLRIGIACTTKQVLDKMGKEDTDTARRQFRAAVAYWIEKGIAICSTTSGYFIPIAKEEIESCVRNKERQANANLKRAAYLRGMNLASSITVFNQERKRLGVV